VLVRVAVMENLGLALYGVAAAAIAKTMWQPEEAQVLAVLERQRQRALIHEDDEREQRRLLRALVAAKSSAVAIVLMPAARFISAHEVFGFRVEVS
jgi:superfamily II DNA helicase RecQ